MDPSASSSEGLKIRDEPIRAKADALWSQAMRAYEKGAYAETVTLLEEYRDLYGDARADVEEMTLRSREKLRRAFECEAERLWERRHVETEKRLMELLDRYGTTEFVRANAAKIKTMLDECLNQSASGPTEVMLDDFESGCGKWLAGTGVSIVTVKQDRNGKNALRIVYPENSGNVSFARRFRKTNKSHGRDLRPRLSGRVSSSTLSAMA